jgi:hypothetical protein
MAKDNNLLVCPECSHQFSPTDQIYKEIEQQLKKQSQEELNRSKAAIEAKIRAQIKEEFGLDLVDLKNQLEEKNRKLLEANRNELELRQKTRKLEEKEKELELEVQRKVDSEKVKATEEITRKLNEEFQLKLNEKELQLNSFKKTVDELKRKAHQGSQQLQGEAFEIAIERTLNDKFPYDQISEVKKGKKGADIFQIVMAPNGEEAGAILIESKNTKAWGNDWIAKGKEDQREAKADLLVIVSEVLPPGVTHFGMLDGVWVTDFASLPSLVLALRIHLLELNQARIANIGKGEKMDCLYQYMTETQFKQRIEGIIQGFTMMKTSLEKEKAAMKRIWAQREQCLEMVIGSTSAMYGDVQAIIGSALPKVSYLELESWESLPAPEEE